jgi:hypothetical protein
MTKFTKFVVLGAGVLGLVAFFMPLIHVKQGGFEGKASGLDVMKGFSEAEQAVGEAQVAVGELGETDAHQALGEVKSATNTAKWLFLIPFVFPVLFLLTGGIGALTRFGRGMGALTLVFGLIAVALWFLIRAAGDSVKTEAGVEDPLGSGVMMLGVSYFLATFAGLFALIKPEPKKQAAQAPAPPAQ